MSESGFALLSGTHAFALRLQPSELLWRENSFSATQKCLAAFLRAACLHSFILPRLNLGLLVRGEIQRAQINARDCGHVLECGGVLSLRFQGSVRLQLL